MNEKLTQKVQKELKDNYLTYRDLCPHTGYTLGTIRVFFSRGLTDTQADEMLSAIEAIKEERRKNVKTPQEIKEEFERLNKDDQKVILEAYEKLGLHVVAEQCKEYKDLYSAYLTANNDMKRASLMAGLKKIRRWMRHDLNTWVVTELTGDEICDKLERVVEEERKKRRHK